MQIILQILLMNLCLTTISVGSCANASELIQWSGAFDGFSDLSAIVCFDQTKCAIASDEGNSLQWAELSQDALYMNLQGTTILDPSASEIDLEGLAYDPQTKSVYATGSHALSKKNKYQESRFKIYKIPSETGRVETSSLIPLIEKHPFLQTHFKKQLVDNGVNVEALAIQGGFLYVGFRAPVKGPEVVILKVDPDKLFNGQSPPSEEMTFFVNIGGTNWGLRDMAPLQKGFLLLTGAASPDETDISGIYYWDGSGKMATLLVEIDASKSKPEGITVLRETKNSVDVILLDDDISGGALRRLQIKRPHSLVWSSFSAVY